MNLGAHQSIAGGISKALESIDRIGGNCLQIFSSSPRTWQNATMSDKDIVEFQKKKKEDNIDPVVFHACYLINLADKGIVGKKSINNVIHELHLAAKMGVLGSIVHTGSFKSKKNGAYDFTSIEKENYKILIENIGKILEKVPHDVLLILENSGTHKIGTTIEELAQIVKDIKDERVQVCLDTCHLHASGYDISTQDAFERFIENFDNLIGLDRLTVWHLNDSKDALGSFRDRHENIGEGKVGIAVFQNILNSSAMRDKVFIIETPGFDGKGPDKKNIDILKSCIQ